MSKFDLLLHFFLGVKQKLLTTFNLQINSQTGKKKMK